MTLSFVLPLLAWSVLSYVPFVWHPLIKIDNPGSVSYFEPGMLVERETFADENRRRGPRRGPRPPARAPTRSTCPAPHEVARALYVAFKTPPRLPSEPWLHESLWHSIQVIFWGFTISSLVGVPLGILCGAFPGLLEAFRALPRVLPLPAGAGVRRARGGRPRDLTTGPRSPSSSSARSSSRCSSSRTRRASSTRRSLEAAQTLGASRAQLLFKVVVPGIIVDLYTDMRILLGWAWTYLIVAELIGTMSGISYFINQQARYRNYQNVFAAIFIIGFIGLGCDVVLASGRREALSVARREARSVARHDRPAARRGPQKSDSNGPSTQPA